MQAKAKSDVCLFFFGIHGGLWLTQHSKKKTQILHWKNCLFPRGFVISLFMPTTICPRCTAIRSSARKSLKRLKFQGGRETDRKMSRLI